MSGPRQLGMKVSGPPGKPTRARFVVLAFACVGAALAYLTRNAIAVAESTVRGDLGFTKEQSGWLMGAFFITYSLGQIPAAQVGRRLGSRQSLSLFAVLSSLGAVGSAFATGLGSAVLARGVQGIGQAGLVPLSTVIVSRWFPLTGRAFATGALASFMSAGGALCAWLTGLLLEALSPRVATGWNWRWTFLIFSVPGFIWAAWFWRWFRDEPKTHSSVNALELDLITGNVNAPDELAVAGVTASVQEATPWLSLISSPALWWLCTQQAFRSAGYVFFSSWFATYLQETRGVSISKSGFLSMLPLLALVAGSLAGGAVSDWLLRRTGSRNLARRWLSIIAMIASAGLIFWARTVQEALPAVLLISIGSFFAGTASPCAYALTIDMGGRHIGAINATMNMIGNFGALLFPLAAPWMLARFGNWDAVIGLFAGIYICAAACWMLLKTEGTMLDQALFKKGKEA